jgi:hypothetical protein
VWGRLWRLQIAHAFRLTIDDLSGHLSIVAALVGGLVCAILAPESGHLWIRIKWGVIGVIAGPLLIGVWKYLGHWLPYLYGRYHDDDLEVIHDDSAPNVLFLQLRSKVGFDMSLVLRLWVYAHDTLTEVPDGDLRLLGGNNRVISYEFSAKHQLFPGETYEVHWLQRDDRKNFFPIASEKFQLQDYGGQAWWNRTQVR